MFHYRTQGYNGYAVKYSPFFDNRLACAASANFGLVGNGRLYILGLTPGGIVGEKWCVSPPKDKDNNGQWKIGGVGDGVGGGRG